MYLKRVETKNKTKQNKTSGIGGERGSPLEKFRESLDVKQIHLFPSRSVQEGRGRGESSKLESEYSNYSQIEHTLHTHKLHT